MSRAFVNEDSAEELLLSKRVETNESGTLDALVAHIRQRLPGL